MTAQIVIYTIANATPTRARDTAMSGCFAPIYFPTIEFIATFIPTAGMKLSCKNAKAIQPAAMSFVPKPPTKTVINKAQQIISFPH